MMELETKVYMKCPLFFVCLLAFAGTVSAQDVPFAPERPWFSKSESSVSMQAARSKGKELSLDRDRKYSLPELIDLAEAHSPETREAWQAARQQAATLRVAQSSLYPQLDVGFTALTNRNGVLLYNTFVIQELGIGQAQAKLDYTLFDANERLNHVRAERNLLRAASFSFNEAHRQLLFAVMHAYYLLLDAKGQRVAAEANLTSATSVSNATQARFDNGLATLPDLSEAKSTAAQANYELQLRPSLRPAISSSKPRWNSAPIYCGSFPPSKLRNRQSARRAAATIPPSPSMAI
jgi:outer membrane protein